MIKRTGPALLAALALAAAPLAAHAQSTGGSGTSTSKPGGTFKGAAVGAVAGHMMGHHTKTGAVAGAAVGHHIRAKSEKSSNG